MEMEASTIAKYIILLGIKHNRPTVCKLRLQKLLYYSQGIHLSLFKEPLFADAIIAWPHGPVVIDVYFEYKKYKSAPIQAKSLYNELNRNSNVPTDKQIHLMGWVSSFLAPYAAWQLRNMTHEELPWLETDLGEEISQDRIKKFFETKAMKKDPDSFSEAVSNGIDNLFTHFDKLLSFDFYNRHHY